MKINKYLYYTFFAGLTLTTSISCNKLDLNPESQLNQNTVIVDAGTAQIAVEGVYGSLKGIVESGDFTFDIIAMPGGFSDELVWSGTFPTRGEFSNFNLSTPNLTNQRLYQNFYYITRGVNDYIDKIQKVDHPTLTDELKKHYIAELRFLRAYAYFNLLNYYGGVPIIKEATNSSNLKENSELTRSTAAETAAFIKDDLNYAFSNIDNSVDGGGTKVDMDVMNAFAARFYLYQKDYVNAKSYADDLINSRPALVPYNTIFGRATPNLSESIWYLPSSDANSNSVAFYFLPSSLGGRNEMSVRNPDMFTDEDDLRKNESIKEDVVNKYRNVSGTDAIILYRMGEMYLIAAEAAARAGSFTEADDYINAVRTRAGLGDVSLDATNYLDLILEERKLELCFEPGGHRYIDLRRTGKAASVLGSLGYKEPKDLLWPIPFAERQANKNMDQNPEYN